MVRRRIGFVVCVLALAGGCASGPRVPAAGSQFDGTYDGTSRLVSDGGFVCGAVSYRGAITVTDGRFDYVFVDSLAKPTPIPIQIAADGSFSGRMQYGAEDFGPRSRLLMVWVTVTGHISGPELHAIAADYRCTRSLTLQKR
jgi:hypothetical protein